MTKDGILKIFQCVAYKKHPNLNSWWDVFLQNIEKCVKIDFSLFFLSANHGPNQKKSRIYETIDCIPNCAILKSAMSKNLFIISLNIGDYVYSQVLAQMFKHSNHARQIINICFDMQI